MPNNLNFFYGEDTFSQKKLLKLWESEFTKKHGEQNITKFYGDKLNIGNIISSSNSLPFLAEKRLIIIFDFLENLKKYSDKDLESFKNFLEEGSSETSVILFIENGKPDGRTSFFKFLNKVSNAKNFQNPERDDDFIKLIKKEFELKNATISDENIRYLFYRIGRNLGSLRNEIEKLVIFCCDKEITKKDIEDITPKNSESMIWNFLDSFAGKNPKEIMDKLKDEIDSGAEPRMIFFMIVRQFRLFIEANSDPSHPSEALRRLPPWSKKKLISAAKRLDIEKLKKFYLRLLKIDLDSKTGKIKTSTEDQRMFLLEIEKLLIDWCLV